MYSVMQMLPTQVTYTEVMISSLGSLSYAEDDSRHIVGIKTAQAATTAGSTLSAEPTGEPGDIKFCCHVIECENEVSI
jgi:hypothetical protein